MARSTLEAQFQDVRAGRSTTSTARFVNLQPARIDMLTAQAAVRRQEQFLAELRAHGPPRRPTSAERSTTSRSSLERSRNILGDAIEAFEDAQEGLGVLLAMPPGRDRSLVPQGLLRDAFPPPPPVEELAALALRAVPTCTRPGWA